VKYLFPILCLAGCGILIGSCAAVACPPVAFRSYSYTTPAYAAPIYHAPAVATYPYPAYFVAYGGGQQDALLSEIKLLRADQQIQALKMQLLLLQQGGGNVQPVPNAERVPEMPKANGAAAVPGQEVQAVSQACASCHSNGNAKGKHQMFANFAAVKMTPDQLGSCIQHVLDGTMPKNGKLTDAQKLAVLQGLTKWPTQ
jgi:mono/diheme cytochrome c family protein